jgi:hypothetical protein
VGGKAIGVLSGCRDKLTFLSLSGRDNYETLDAAHLYHEHDYRALPHPLQIPQDGYAQGQFAYASHSSGPSLSGKRIALSILCLITASHVDAIQPF